MIMQGIINRYLILLCGIDCLDFSFRVPNSVLATLKLSTTSPHDLFSSRLSARHRLFHSPQVHPSGHRWLLWAVPWYPYWSTSHCHGNKLCAESRFSSFEIPRKVWCNLSSSVLVPLVSGLGWTILSQPPLCYFPSFTATHLQ